MIKLKPRTVLSIAFAALCGVFVVTGTPLSHRAAMTPPSVLSQPTAGSEEDTLRKYLSYLDEGSRLLVQGDTNTFVETILMGNKAISSLTDSTKKTLLAKKLAEVLEPLCGEPYPSPYPNLYAFAVMMTAEYGYNANDKSNQPHIINIYKEAYKKYHSTEIYNDGRLLITIKLCKLMAANLNTPVGKAKFSELDALYKEIDKTIFLTHGRQYIVWPAIQAEHADLYLCRGQRGDTVTARQLLHQGFDTLTSEALLANPENAANTLRYTNNYAPLFSRMADDEDYLAYAIKVAARQQGIGDFQRKQFCKQLSDKMGKQIDADLKALQTERALRWCRLRNDLFTSCPSQLLSAEVSLGKNHYDMACCYYLQGDSARAMETLSEAFALLEDFVRKQEPRSTESADRVELQYRLMQLDQLVRWAESPFSPYVAQNLTDKKALLDWLSLNNQPRVRHYLQAKADTLLRRIALKPDEKMRQTVANTYLQLSRTYTASDDDPYASEQRKWLGKAAQQLTDTTSSNYISLMGAIGDIYNLTLLEPEMAARYYRRAAEMAELAVEKQQNPLTKNFFSVYYNWENLAKCYEYLNRKDDMVDALTRQVYWSEKELFSGSLTANVGLHCSRVVNRYEKMMQLVADVMVEFPEFGRSTRYRRIRNPHPDPEKHRQLADSVIAAYRKWTNPMTPHVHSMIASVYLRQLHDTLNALQSLREMQQAVVREHPDDYRRQRNYYDAGRRITELTCPDSLTAFLEEQAGVFAGVEEQAELYSRIECDLGSAYGKAGRYDDMRRCYLKAIEVGKTIGKSHSVTTPCYEFCYNSYQAGRLDLIDAATYSLYAEEEKGQMLKSFVGKTAAEREQDWSGLYEFIPFGLGEWLRTVYGTPVPATTLYDNVLLRKNILLNTSISAENLIRSSGDESLQQKLRQADELQRLLSESKDSLTTGDGLRLSRGEAQTLLRRLNEIVIGRASRHGDYTASLAHGWRDVQQALGPGDLAVEFCWYDTSDSTSAYGALKLACEGEPEFIPLATYEQLDSIPADSLYTTTALYRLFWQPVLGDSRPDALYFCPEGPLCNIGMEYALLPGGTRLSERQRTYRLSSTRHLLPDTRQELPPQQQAVLYGGLFYNISTDLMAADSKKYPDIGHDYTPSQLADTMQLRGAMSTLPATQVEVDEISQLLSDKEIATRVFTGSHGTEASLKSLSGQKIDILHLATHGFFADGNSRTALDRCGLLLAGAANKQKGIALPPGVDDGVLTGREISQLNFSNLDLVVLSACETGLGQLAGSETFGLQRAFKKAGAHTIMMSLWKVDDRATQLLMTNFYSHLLSGKSKLDALRSAQHDLRTIDHGRYDNPIYWASFILLDGMKQ